MSFDPTEFAAVGLILVGMCGVVLAAFWRPFTQRRDRFARRLDLSRSQRRLLRLLSESLGEPDCLPLLIGQGCFEKAVVQAELDERAMVAVEQLRSRLFRRP
jgi:hypothetical protein